MVPLRINCGHDGVSFPMIITVAENWKLALHLTTVLILKFLRSFAPSNRHNAFCVKASPDGACVFLDIASFIPIDHGAVDLFEILHHYVVALCQPHTSPRSALLI
jgi:hypothetical protein